MERDDRRSRPPERRRRPRSDARQARGAAGTAEPKKPARRSPDKPPRRPAGEHEPARRRRRQPEAHKPRRARKRLAFGKLFGHSFAVRLVTTAAIAAALILCFMIFFRVQTVSVVGNSMYTQEEIQKASGVTQGNALLMVNKTAVASRIIAELPYVDQVRVSVSLPDTVKIEVEELKNAYAVAAEDGTYWLINSDGRLVEQITAKEAGDYLQIQGVRIRSAETGQTMQVLEEAAPQPSEDTAEDAAEDTEDTAAPEASAQKRMDVAMELLGYLEQTADVRSVTVVDVSSIYNIEIWYGSQYEVKLGGNTQLEYKIEYMVAAIAQLDSYQSGVLDLTFDEAKTARFIPWSS